MPTPPSLFYHVTRQANLQSIKVEGLTPRIGPLSTLIDEQYKRIYLFDSMESVENALLNWFGEAVEEVFGEDEPFALLAIPARYVVEPQPTFEEDETSFEWYTEHRVKPSHIALLSLDI